MTTRTITTMSWTGTTAAIVGSILVAINVGQHMVVWGYGWFLLSSICWGYVSFRQRDRALLLMQTVFCAINLVGLWRWSVP